MATKQEDKSQRSLRGRMLVASPSADASPYRRSVVLVLEHNAEGAAAAVLDADFAASLEKLREQLPMLAGRQQSQLPAQAGLPVKIATWQPGQLDHEVRGGLWFNLPANAQQILNEGLPPWHKLVQEVGRSIYREALGIRNFPEHVSAN